MRKRLISASLLLLLLTGCAASGEGTAPPVAPGQPSAPQQQPAPTQQGPTPLPNHPTEPAKPPETLPLPNQPTEPATPVQPNPDQAADPATPAESGPTPFEVQFQACEAQLQPPPAEQRITVTLDGRPDLLKAIFLNGTYYQEVARCFHGGADAGTPLPIVDGHLQLAGPRYYIDIAGSYGQFANDRIDLQPKVELVNGRVYIPFDLDRYGSSWFDEANQTLILQSRPPLLASPSNLPFEMKERMTGDGRGLRGGFGGPRLMGGVPPFGRSGNFWAFGKPGLQFKELAINDFQPHIELVTEGGTELLVGHLQPWQRMTGFWLHLPGRTTPLLIGRTGDQFALGFPTPAEAFERYRQELGVPGKVALPITVTGERAVGAFDLAGERFYVYFQHQTQTSESQFAGWVVEGITWDQDCERFEYCPPAWR